MADQPDYDKVLKDLENAIEVMRNNRDTPVRAIPIIISTIKLVDLIGNMDLSDYERTFVAAAIFCSLAEHAQQQAKVKEN
jgi:hypothetical protein